jgi:hypothetical protein
MLKISYEQPSLKKYGTMKEFTLGGNGSGGDFVGRISNENTQDPTSNNRNTYPLINDYFFVDTNNPGKIFVGDPIVEDTRILDRG